MCGKLWSILKNKEQNRIPSRETDSKWSPRETIDISVSKLYYKVTISSKKEYNLGSVQ